MKKTKRTPLFLFFILMFSSGMIGNVLKVSDLTEAATASLQFGFNLIFD
jgi:hypothetical protein